MVQWLRLCAPDAGGWGQGTRSYIPQGRLKTLHAAAKNRYSQIHKYFKNHEMSQVLSGCRCFGTITELFPFSSKNIKLFGIAFMGELNSDSICYLLILEGLMLKKTEGQSRGWQRMRWLDSITDSMDTNLSKL